MCLQLTLARNKPILFRDLDLKTILYDAYEQGKMIAVLPFINKVCATSYRSAAMPTQHRQYTESFTRAYMPSMVARQCDAQMYA